MLAHCCVTKFRAIVTDPSELMIWSPLQGYNNNPTAQSRATAFSAREAAPIAGVLLGVDCTLHTQQLASCTRIDSAMFCTQMSMHATTAKKNTRYIWRGPRYQPAFESCKI
eukprot:4486554-Amphidinium_carterae.1